jgi:hypothetical protein
MTSLEAYKKFELKINSLDNSDSIDISKGEFVLIYNEQQPKWFEKQFTDRSSRYRIDGVQGLIEMDTALTLEGSTDRYTEFKLPTNYFDYINSRAIGSRGKCKKGLKIYQATRCFFILFR